MSPSAKPVRVELDPDAGTLPAALESIESVTAVLLVAGGAARASEWAPRAAVALAAAWNAAGRRVILVDLDLAAPRLHDFLGADNVEGIVDAVAFGASLRQVAQPAPDASLRLVAPGAYVPDREEVYTTSEWRRLIAEAEAEGALLVVYAPDDAAGLAALAGRFEAVVALGEARVPGEAPEPLAVVAPAGAGAEPDAEAHRVAGAEPASREPAEARREDGAGPASPEPAEATPAPEAAARPEPEPRPVAEPHRLRMPPHRLRPEPAWPHPEPEEKLIAEPPMLVPASARRRKGGGRNWTLIALLLILTALLAYAAVEGVRWYRSRDAAAPAEGAEPAAPAPSSATPVAAADASGAAANVDLAYSVSIEAHQSLELAMRRLGALRRAEPEIGFFVSPINVSGELWIRVMAGPVADSAAAAALQRRLVAEGHKSDYDEWANRPTEFAFALGAFDARAAADTRVAELVAAGIPAYVVRYADEGGAARFRIYGGAFEGRGEAAVMEELLRKAGLDAPLVRRTGLPAA